MSSRFRVLRICSLFNVSVEVFIIVYYKWRHVLHIYNSVVDLTPFLDIRAIEKYKSMKGNFRMQLYAAVVTYWRVPRVIIYKCLKYPPLLVLVSIFQIVSSDL